MQRRPAACGLGRPGRNDAAWSQTWAEGQIWRWESRPLLGQVPTEHALCQVPDSQRKMGGKGVTSAVPSLGNEIVNTALQRLLNMALEILLETPSLLETVLP